MLISWLYVVMHSQCIFYLIFLNKKGVESTNHICLKNRVGSNTDKKSNERSKLISRRLGIMLLIFFLKIKVSVRNSGHVFKGLSFFNILRVITRPKCFILVLSFLWCFSLATKYVTEMSQHNAPKSSVLCRW